MLTYDNWYVSGFEAAIRGMRNPLNSHDKIDSRWTNGYIDNDHVTVQSDGEYMEYQVGKNDLKLMKTLSKAGSDHAKFLRMINVTVDITAPLYWWKEFDTYKVGTVANSCSTMHRLTHKPFELSDFSFEHLIGCHSSVISNILNGRTYREIEMTPYDTAKVLVDYLNELRELYLETKSKEVWWQMIQLLPSSYNQKRTVQLNYQVLKNMYFARRNHKLDEWHTLCDWMLMLPLFQEICVEVHANE